MSSVERDRYAAVVFNNTTIGSLFARAGSEPLGRARGDKRQSKLHCLLELATGATVVVIGPLVHQVLCNSPVTPTSQIYRLTYADECVQVIIIMIMFFFSDELDVLEK